MAIQSPLPQGGVDVIVVTTVFLALAILAVIGRFYSRYLQRKPISIDDYLIVVALGFTSATVGVGYALVLGGGVGLHMTEATMDQIALSLKLFVPAPLLWAFSTSLIKLSVLFFYISIFSMRNLRSAVIGVISLTIALIVAVIFESFLLCRPFAFTWDKTIPGGVCGSTTHAYLAIAIVNLVIDLAVVVLPMPILWGLQMPIGKKMAISAILCLGLLICGLTAARIKSVLDLDPLDFTYTVVPDLIFGALEIELGIVNACLPIMRPVVRKFFGSDSDFLKGWSKKTQTHDSSFKNHKGTAQSTSKGFDRLPEDMYPLGKMEQGAYSNEMMAQTQVGSNSYGDVEQGMQQTGDIMVRRDLYVYRTPTEPAATAM